MLTASQILAANDIQTAKVFVPEWAPEGTPEEEAFVIVRTLTGAQREETEQAFRENNKNARALIMIMGTIDDKGNLLFTPEDIERLSAKSVAPLDRVCDKILELSSADKKGFVNAQKN